MKLNPDCIRDILLTVENNEFGGYFTLTSLRNKLSQYSIEELHYCCLKLNEADYLDLITAPMMRTHIPGIKAIYDLTFEGHEFLEDIKSDSNWNKTKDIAKKVGSFSLNTLKDISVEVISSVINSHL